MSGRICNLEQLVTGRILHLKSIVNNMNRRLFLNTTALAAPTIFAAATLNNMPDKNIFVHHVYFWLKNPDSKADKDKLVEGLQKLSKVKTIKMFHIGQPATTNRDVIDRSYAISWLVLFDNKANQDSYQTDPIHLKFVEECSSLWTKVVVYDSEDAV
jgi:hypothetical protein